MGWADINDLWWLNPKNNFTQIPQIALGFAEQQQRRREFESTLPLRAKELELRAKEHLLSYQARVGVLQARDEQLRRESEDLAIISQRLLNPDAPVAAPMQSFRGAKMMMDLDAVQLKGQEAQQRLADEKWWNTTINSFLPSDRMQAQSMRTDSDGKITPEISAFLDKAKTRATAEAALRKGPAGVFAAALALRRELGGLTPETEKELLDSYLNKLSGIQQIESRLADVDKILLRGEVDAVNRDILSSPEEKQAALNAIEEKYKKKLGEAAPESSPKSPTRLRYNPATGELIPIP